MHRLKDGSNYMPALISSLRVQKLVPHNEYHVALLAARTTLHADDRALGNIVAFESRDDIRK